ncbi:hypothetical protein VTH06DRAFT_1735 [Thermothelomyces fergusii]
MSDPRKYTVGWISPSGVARRDSNSYALGRIGRHNVVIAALPSGSYGLVAAAVAARDMLHSFPNVRLGLLVGTGGGAPGPGRDVRLGDVVVGIPGDGRGGVFQYDYGKAVQDQPFRVTAFLNRPPTALLTAVTQLRATHELRGHRLADDVNEALGRIRDRHKYMRPPPESDRLYRSDVVHPARSADGCGVACGTDEARLVARRRRDGEEEDDPAIHYGLVASGNRLVMDALFRDRLADEHGVLCFEMEAAGLMNHFPCLVIRGISNYADSHKNDEWQGYAAMTAAAYAKDLLSHVPVRRVEAEERVVDEVGSKESRARA